MTQLLIRAALAALILATPASTMIAQPGERGSTRLSSPCVRMLGCYVNDAREWSALLGNRPSEGTILVPTTERSMTTLLPFDNDGVDALFAAVLMPRRGFEIAINSNRARSADLGSPRSRETRSPRRDELVRAGAAAASTKSDVALPGIGPRADNEEVASRSRSTAPERVLTPSTSDGPRDFENPRALDDARRVALGNDDGRADGARQFNRDGPRQDNADERDDVPGNDDVTTADDEVFTGSTADRGLDGLPVGTLTSPGNAVGSPGQGAGALTGNATSTPEPASIALLATGLAGIGGARWKRRNK